MLDQNLVLVIFLSSIALANRVLYYYNDKKNKRARIDSLRSFVYIHKYLRFSTLFIAIVSIYSNHQYLYKILVSDYTYLGACLSSLSVLILFIRVSIILHK